MDIFEQTIAAGETVRVERSAARFMVAEADDTVRITLYRNGAAFFDAPMKAGEGGRVEGGFGAISIANETGDALAVRVFITPEDVDVQVRDGIRVETVNNGRALVTSQETVTNADAQLCAADADAKYLLIQNNHATDAIYVKTGAGAATIANGIKIKAGGSYEFAVAPTNEVRAIGDAAANAQVIVVRG